MQHFSQAVEREALATLVQRLEELLDRPAQQVQFNPRLEMIEGKPQLDVLIEIPGHMLAVVFQPNSDLALIVKAAERLGRLSKHTDSRWIWILATRSMTAAGRQRCQEAGVSWIDLAGNAHIRGDGLYLHVEGRPNPFKPQGRPSSVFAPKSSRIPRWLLIHPERFFSQRELAQATAMDEGFTSRIVGRLEDQKLIRRNREGQIKVSNPDLLLDAWAQEYDFFKHEVHRRHVPARTGQELLQSMQATLQQLGWDTAATGLAAAWTLSHFAGFRITTLYLRNREDSARLPELGSLGEETPGANLWLVFPNDEGVFQGGAVHAEGIVCVHPVQAWLDLKAHPERAAEAAQQLRAEFAWKAARAR